MSSRYRSGRANLQKTGDFFFLFFLPVGGGEGMTFRVSLMIPTKAFLVGTVLPTLYKCWLTANTCKVFHVSRLNNPVIAFARKSRHRRHQLILISLAPLKLFKSALLLLSVNLSCTSTHTHLFPTLPPSTYTLRLFRTSRTVTYRSLFDSNQNCADLDKLLLKFHCD